LVLLLSLLFSCSLSATAAIEKRHGVAATVENIKKE
jgi:hypothetical protein